MGLLDKFDAVVIKQDTRVDAADTAYCEQRQNDYVYMNKRYRELVVLLEGYINERAEIGAVSEDYRSMNNFGCVDVGTIRSTIRESHKNFIVVIVEYFTRKYKVTLSYNDIADILLPKKPKNEGWIAQYHKEELDAYNEKLYDMELSYKDILDQIFIQLGGISFADKALDELKERVHRGAWNMYRGEKNYEQKKAVISLTGYACSFDSWHAEFHKDTHRIELSDGTKNVLTGIVHFEYGCTPSYHPLIPLLGYKYETINKETEFHVHMNKFKSVKFFKNGRVDLRFASESYARQFVEEYIGLDA